MAHIKEIMQNASHLFKENILGTDVRKAYAMGVVDELWSLDKIDTVEHSRLSTIIDQWNFES